MTVTKMDDEGLRTSYGDTLFGMVKNVLQQRKHVIDCQMDY